MSPARAQEAATETLEAPKSARVAPKNVRRRQLLDSATALMVSDGSHGVSMQAIADEAGVSVGLIYRYFSNKHELVEAVITSVLDDLAERIPLAAGTIKDPVRRIAALFETYCRIIDERQDATLLTYRESKTLGREALGKILAREIETSDPIRQAIKDAQTEGLMRNVNADLFAEDFVLLAHGWALKHWYFEPRGGFDTYVKHHLATLLSGVIKDKHRKDYADLLGDLR